jgi:hypothetical protein
MTRRRHAVHMTVGIALLISASAGLLVLAFLGVIVGAVSVRSFALTLLLNWDNWGREVLVLVLVAAAIVLRFTLMMVYQERKAGDRDVL